jgi:diguanylate cyclase (GGDEF)-like protein
MSLPNSRTKPIEPSPLARERLGADAEHRFLLRSLSGLRRLAGELGDPQIDRRIPDLLLDALKEAFAPRQAAIFLRRPPRLGEPERCHQMLAATVSSPSVDLRPGAIFDFGVEPRPRDDAGSRVIAFEPPERLGFDLLVPMKKGDECLGAIGVRTRRKPSERCLEVVELIAELAAFALGRASEIDQIRSVADLDGLTGILNKGAVTARLEELLDETGKIGRTLSILLFDVDHFKIYNDNHGHVAGDELLQLMAQVVQESTRRDDTFGRFGGDEFLLIFPGRQLSDAVTAGQNVLAAIRAFDFAAGESQPLGRITVSAGVSASAPGCCTATELMVAADEALYRAKSAGRDRILSTRMPRPTVRRLRSPA